MTKKEVCRNFAREYHFASKKRKGEILHQLCAVLGWSRDNARRQVKRAYCIQIEPSKAIRKKRPLKYSGQAKDVLANAWAISGQASGLYLYSQIQNGLLERLIHHQELHLGLKNKGPLVGPAEPFRQRALHMMILCLVCTVYFLHTYDPYFSPREYYYRDYIDCLEGGLNREKITFLEGEKQRIQAVQDELISLAEAGVAKGDTVDERVQELNYALRKGMAIDEVSNRLDYLKHKLLEIKNSTLPQVEKQEIQLATGQIFYERGYLELFGQSYMPYRQDFLGALVLILMAIWLVLLFVCQEWESGMFQLIRGSSGLGKLISLKINLLIGYFSLAFFFLNLSLVYLMNKHYSLHLLNKKIVIGSIPDFSNFKFSIYLGQYLSLLLILCYLAFLVTLIFLVFLALKFKSQVKASIAAFTFLLLPLILYHLGIRSSEYLLLNPFLSGNVLLNLWQGRGIYLYFLLGPMIIFLWTRIKVECRK